jgi:hypothetical protein
MIKKWTAHATEPQFRKSVAKPNWLGKKPTGRFMGALGCDHGLGFANPSRNDE